MHFIHIVLLSTAQAVPLQLTQQGRLLEPGGAAVTGLHDLHFRIYDDATAGNLLWEDDLQVDFLNGYYAAVLGADEGANPLDSDTLSLFPLYLELELDSNGPMTPRQAMTSAPYAQLAGTAQNLDGGSVNATSVSIGSTQVIDSTGSWTGTLSVDWNSELTNIPGDLLDGDDNTQLSDTDVRAYVEAASVDLHTDSTKGGQPILTEADDQDTLAGLTCSTSELAGWNGTDWVCVSDNALDEQGVEDAVTNGAIDLHSDSTIGGLAILTDADDDDSFADLGMTCVEDGEVAIWDAAQQEWYCGEKTVELVNIDVSGATEGQVLGIVDGALAWTDPAGGCNLTNYDDAARRGVIQCGSTSFRVESTPSAYTDIEMAAGGANHCGQDTDGKIWCVDGSYDDGMPSDPMGDFCVGDSYTCGADLSGAVTCWGSDAHGLRSDAPSGSYDKLACGGRFACALDASGAMTCWGQDADSQVSGAPSGPFTDISLGTEHGCGLDASGALTCWGHNGYGQSTAPAGTYASVHAGEMTSCALDASGTPSCWGNDGYGQATPTSASAFSTLTVSGFRTCGLTTDGDAECWGTDYEEASQPQTGPFTDIAGYYHITCALTEAGLPYCWGDAIDWP
jgi:hypothetical protein